MTKSTDVTAIGWKPSWTKRDGSGDVTIEHTVVGDTKTPMTEDGARRLADCLFGADKTEVGTKGASVRWKRGNRSKGARIL
jgi:hypothetical protein